MQLKDKIAIITGAARGIGREIALGLAKEGANIVIDYNTSEGAADTLQNEIKGLGRRALKVKADVRKSAEVEKMVEMALSEFGRIDFLVNNAGVNKPRVVVSELSEEDWDRIIETNLKGTYLCSRAVLDTMMEQKSGRIVNITSGRGFTGQALDAAYSASKGGIIAFTKSLSLELAPYNVNVNAIAPGRTDTDMWRGGKSAEEIAERLSIPPLLTRGVCSTKDIFGTVMYLVTDASRYVTGQVMILRTP